MSLSLSLSLSLCIPPSLPPSYPTPHPPKNTLASCQGKHTAEGAAGLPFPWRRRSGGAALALAIRIGGPNKEPDSGAREPRSFSGPERRVQARGRRTQKTARTYRGQSIRPSLACSLTHRTTVLQAESVMGLHFSSSSCSCLNHNTALLDFFCNALASRLAPGSLSVGGEKIDHLNQLSLLFYLFY
ncbi:hypothetical protein ANANG_G00293340 [Anguilla anguilla]|uniref:Uncharacterized protein n=1 Tax=Anguilla anguilla TaxID=7936 RepID=A0A9D3RJ90_ANGAN|nr:hypothetical protein ANANG_G00293340 [Anguilla anguilla]